LNFFSDPSRIS